MQSLCHWFILGHFYVVSSFHQFHLSSFYVIFVAIFFCCSLLIRFSSFVGHCAFSSLFSCLQLLCLCFSLNVSSSLFFRLQFVFNFTNLHSSFLHQLSITTFCSNKCLSMQWTWTMNLLMVFYFVDLVVAKSTFSHENVFFFFRFFAKCCCCNRHRGDYHYVNLSTSQEHLQLGVVAHKAWSLGEAEVNDLVFHLCFDII